ncbi:rRNA maturation RNase YbeY [Urbifossiella limnaea]|uniref:Endoribonuclease YbeY n=1 Tax=Urbifossiella limnaea TaxID=2528023 RepID=A0A517Y081_9BACT|nr:rRNA maturation RNase YbeY [Urbifossiella limnaea]QDU23171.1 Endoribonuclease YbeY [Urbifossiella limnaea]
MIRARVSNPYEYPLDFAALKDAARVVLEGEGVREAAVTLAFVDDAHIHRLNKQFLNHDEPTDVLTFPHSAAGAKKLEGDVVIGYGVATEYAADRGHAVGPELVLYVVHGCLHLCGYTDTDDRGAAAMRAKEREYLTKLGLPDIAGE